MHRSTDVLPTVDVVGRSGAAAPAARATDPVRPLVLAAHLPSPGPGRTPSQHVRSARADGSPQRRTTDSTAQDRDPEAGRTRP